MTRVNIRLVFQSEEAYQFVVHCVSFQHEGQVEGRCLQVVHHEHSFALLRKPMQSLEEQRLKREISGSRVY